MNQQAKALSLAYEIVTKKLHLNLKDLSEKTNLDPKTLRRIREGQRVKLGTYDYALSCLFDLIEAEYQNDLVATGGESSIFYLRIMRLLLLELLGKRDDLGGSSFF